jgi:recombinational DNA repair protein RecR
MENNQKLDEWDEALEKHIVVLKECQQSFNFDSCNPCEKFFDCEIRKKYVIAVYESMNKGSTGGFEF